MLQITPQMRLLVAIEPVDFRMGIDGLVQLCKTSSTQWDMVAEASSLIQPAYDELIRQAAQGHVLHNDQLAREPHLTAGERLQLHQQESGPTMARLREWLKRQSEQKLVEPNSGLGTAINYLRKHWGKLTLFRESGCPGTTAIDSRVWPQADSGDRGGE